MKIFNSKFNNKGFTFFRRKKAEPLLKLNNNGFTLPEVLIYSAILAITVGVIVTFVNQMLGVNETTRRVRESTDNARRVLDTIAQEVRHSSSVYDQTSVFGSSPGQLSLETTRDLPADENSTYVDFYVDNQALYMKREGQNAQLITSEKVKITSLTFTNLNGSSSRPAVRIVVTVEYNNPISGPKNSVTMTTTAVLRTL